MPRLVPVVVIACWILAGSARAADAVEIVDRVPEGLPRVKAVTALTKGPEHHFVGYYGICPWDGGGAKIFCLRAGFGDRLVRADDRADVCLIDAKTGRLEKVAETAAWNLQQGAMLHWSPAAPERELLYNDRVEGKLVTVVLDVPTSKKRLLDRPLAALAPDGKTGIALNYDRLRQIRPVTGYAGGTDAGPVVKRPNDDGLFHVDVASGKGKLLLSVRQACAAVELPEVLAEQPLWLEHPVFSRDGTRLYVILRGFDPKTRRLVSVPLTLNADGTGAKALLPAATGGASHHDWLTGGGLVLTREVKPGAWRHLVWDDLGKGPRELAPDVLTRDGHCTLSPDGRWLVTDTYPDENRRQHLFVVDMKTGRAARVASFATPETYKGDWRCDLHPRWDRTSTRVCIDSTHSGMRQVYAVELAVPGR